VFVFDAPLTANHSSQTTPRKPRHSLSFLQRPIPVNQGLLPESEAKQEASLNTGSLFLSKERNMNSKLALATIFSIVLSAATAGEVHAQAVQRSQAVPGAYGRTSMPTGATPPNSPTRYTSNQRISRLQPTGFGNTAPVFGASGRNGLPPTSLDSFVLNAGGHADAIYGDEGFLLPPFFEYTKAHRINRGIHGVRDAGLTTGHGSYLPDATGGDEFVDGPEWSQSGANHGQPHHYSPVPYYERGPERTPGLYDYGFDQDGVHGPPRDRDRDRLPPGQDDDQFPRRL